MAADQAAGLRRRNARQPARCIHVFSDSADATIRLAQALTRRGRAALVVDACGRLFADSPTRSLFDWKQQLARGQLQTLPLACGEGWYAPGVRTDEPALRGALQAYDDALFDGLASSSGVAWMPDAARAAIVEIGPAHDALLRAYGVLKTLARMEHDFPVCLLGDAAACERVRAACEQFLPQGFSRTIYSTAHEDDAFAALAVRMVQRGDEPARSLNKTGNT
jgi:hypothetical protein